MASQIVKKEEAKKSESKVNESKASLNKNGFTAIESHISG